MVKYNACDFFMTRIPLVPVDDYFDMFRDDSRLNKRLREAFDNPMLRETLAVASKDLLNALDGDGSLEGDSKTAEQIRSSLIKYFIRMSTRPTPFGLFSGVSIGRFSDSTSITISEPRYHMKRARPDMEWIYGLVKKIETNKSVVKNLGVRFNDFTYANGNRIEKPNKTFMQHVEEDGHTQEVSSSIRYTSQVRMIEEKYGSFHSFANILDDIFSKNPSVPHDRIETFLLQLLENEFLLSELRPPLTNTDMLDYLTRVLGRIEGNDEVMDYVLKLEAIQKNIDIYNSTQIGEGIDIYREIIRLQSELFECESYLQVDMKSHMENNTLSSDLRDELSHFATSMCRLASSGMIIDEMANYRDLFVERYGYSSEIPLLELLDIDRGLGAPAHYNFDTINRPMPRRQKPDKDEKLKLLMENKLLLALREDRNVVEITDNDINYLCKDDMLSSEILPMDYQQSFELYLLVHSKTPEKVDEAEDYNFTIAPLPMSRGLGKSFGRFSDMLCEDEMQLLNKGFKSQKDLLGEYIVAEITEIPSRGRTSNVSLNNNDFDYQIPLTTNPCERKHVLSVRDLFIGVESGSNQFYIKSKSLGKRVIVTMTCMMNPTFGSNALRFLREISAIRRVDVTAGIASILSIEFNYFPRVVYGKVIIRPEAWRISRQILSMGNAKNNSDKTIFEKKFDSYRQKWKIPQFVYMGEGDNRLMLDLDNSLHRTEIYNELKKNDFFALMLTELGVDVDNYAFANLGERKYVTEIVVPFELSLSDSKKKNKTAKAINVEPLRTLSDISANRMKIERTKLMLLPGNDSWFYYKLYGCSKRQNELICASYNELERIVAKGVASKYFFIRYADPEPHLRIRIKPVREKSLDLYADMGAWFDGLYTDGLISKVANDSYLREVERYGGSKLIDHAEDYFCSDSKLAMKLIGKYRYGDKHLSMDYVGVSFVISALESFGLTLEEQEVILNSRSDSKAYRREFRSNRKMLMRAADSRDDWFEARLSIQNPEVYDLINENLYELKRFAKAVHDFDRQGELTNTKKGIVMSLIHMFCNRLMGDNSWEYKILAMATHSTHDLKGLIKYQQKANPMLVLPKSLI